VGRVAEVNLAPDFSRDARLRSGAGSPG